jgi:tetratricopeptide (TPR) repeat protein
LRQGISGRVWLTGLALGAGLTAGATGLAAQGTPGNGFPGEEPKPVPQSQPAQNPAGSNSFPGEEPKTVQQPGNANSFPGEEPAANGGARRGVNAADDPDGDPVRSPDGPGNVIQDDGFSSSRTGLTPGLDESSTENKPGSSTKTKTRAEVLKDDLDVGSFYLSKKDWKGAQLRFTAAFELDKENPDAVWGLAEAEKHLQLYAQATDHYKLFLSYDPDGPHSREAEKSLQQVESARPKDAKSGDFEGQHK